MYKGFKIRLHPTAEQEVQLRKTNDATRWTWNWALEQQMKRFENKEPKYSTYNLGKMLTVVRNSEENGFLRKVAKNSCKLVLFDLEKAYSRFFDTQKSGEKYTKKNH